MFGENRPGQQPGEPADGQPAAADGQGAGPAGQGGSGGPGGAGGAPQPGRRSFRPGPKIIAIGTAAAAAVAGGTAFAVTQSGGSPRPAVVYTKSAPGPIHVTGMSPGADATGIDGADPIVVAFSGKVAANTPKPKITPHVAGRWTARGDTLVFTPARAFQQKTRVTVRVPGGRSGVRSAGGGLLARPVTARFKTGSYSQGALAVMLAQQGYLPMTWTPTGQAEAGADPAAQTLQGMAYAPPAGTFTWQHGYPAQLRSQWSPDAANPLLKGAVMAFQSEHNMTIDGNLTPKVWTAIITAGQKGQRNTNGYTYALASKSEPESLTIWHDGKVVQHSAANTGIPAAPTADGTFPVYERLRSQVMMGTNPDGSHYADPVQFVAYFNGGDAVHYFPRASFGVPQSLGCVELNLADAAHAWPYLSYGSLVTVTGLSRSGSTAPAAATARHRSEAVPGGFPASRRGLPRPGRASRGPLPGHGPGMYPDLYSFPGGYSASADKVTAQRRLPGKALSALTGPPRRRLQGVTREIQCSV